MKHQRFSRRVLVGTGSTFLAAAVLASASLASRSMAPMVMGNAAAGKVLFSAHCAACHTLAAAGSKGTLGPNLNTLSLSEATIEKQVTDGGKGLMGAAASKYAVSMSAFKGVLTPTQIEDVAAFVYDSTHK